MRIGNGYDAHRLVEGRKLILGGVHIPYDKGLEGHSDADVLVHAIMDALLGAAGLGDIGDLFPDTDKKYKDIQSLELLREVYCLLLKNEYSIINIDSTIIAQEPKLKPYISNMIENISETMNIPSSKVGVKATTEEGMGFTGRKEGIAAMAVCLIKKL